MFSTPEFDQPLFENEPPVHYVICSSGRSGSSLLCDLLIKSGQMGIPTEYLHFEDHAPPLIQRFGIQTQPFDFVHYMKELKRHRTTPNGVFGIKLHSNQANMLISKRVFFEFFPRTTRFIWITRDNVVAQAVSLCIADQTKQWSSQDKASNITPTYRSDAITQAISVTFAQEAFWRRFFLLNDITPLHVTYEALQADANAACRSVASFLGVPCDYDFSLGNTTLKKQGNNLNEEWVQRYKDEYKQISLEMAMVKPS